MKMENKMEKLKRNSGILLHITSLPSDYGWGTFSSYAKSFVDFLCDGGFGVWQVLPFSECAFGNSPYSSISSFAINKYFLDVSQFLSTSELNDVGLYNCESMQDFHTKMDSAISIICDKYRDNYSTSDFRKINKYWVEDYATFVVAKKVFDGVPWTQWPDGIKNRIKLDLENFKSEHKKEIDDIILIQYMLDNQWKKIKESANQKGIEIFGDIPFYVELDSADVWVAPKNWCLENGKPKLVAGVPPDYFNADGQLWGNPIYNFAYMSKNKYDFWLKRIKRQSELFDILRIDHFVAFSRYWAIPASSKTAKSGKWIKGAGNALLKIITSKCKIKIVAEDLGIVTEDVTALKDKYGIPGVKVMQFAFDGEGDNIYQPHNYEKNCVAYLGTHDNNTTMGLLNEGNWDKINRMKKYVRMPIEEGNDVLIENLFVSLYRSSANLIILTAQDILHYGSDTRMNVPGVAEGNWTWKLNSELNRDMCGKFKDWAYTYGRTK